MIRFRKLLAKGVDRSARERGDTIIEVLIAIGIVSLVLTSAYALTNRNIQISQEVQEQAYAQKLVERQVELLRAASIKPTADSCFSTAGVIVSGTACNVTNGGADYTLLLHHLTAVNQYSVQAKWQTLDGKTANVTVYYQVAS